MLLLSTQRIHHVACSCTASMATISSRGDMMPLLRPAVSFIWISGRYGSSNGTVVGLVEWTQAATWKEDPAGVDFTLTGPASSKNCVVMNSVKGAINSVVHELDISIQASNQVEETSKVFYPLPGPSPKWGSSRFVSSMPMNIWSCVREIVRKQGALF